MRAARRVSLLVAFFLLTSAATATAECAWVLWEEILAASASVGVQTAYHAVTGRAAEVECRVLAPKYARSKGQAVINGKVEGDSVSSSTSGSAVEWRYFCLPDTVDPRGPKSK